MTGENQHKEYIKKRQDFWLSLKKIREEMLTANATNGNVLFDAYDFEKYIEEVYGIKLHIIDGNFGGTYEIIDEQKHLIYLLKFR